MALEIKKNINQKSWNDFLIQFSEFNPFPQSFDWGNVLLSEGKEVERLAVFDGDEMLAVILIVCEKLPFGLKYAFSPKGPVLKISNDKFLTTNVMELLLNYFKEKNYIFWRFESNINLQSETLPTGRQVKNLKLVKVKDVNPSNTLVLDLNKSYDELLVAMHPKTRYNIGLSKKKNLHIEEKKDLKTFLELMQKTGDRDNFRLHHKKHYEAVLKSDKSLQVIIYFESKPIATGVFFRFGQTFTYLYGASDYKYRAYMASYLVQDFGLNKAKKEGFKYYDFFGIAPIKEDEAGEWVYDNKHQYAGVTRFKLGFGGQYFNSPGTFEIVLNKKSYFFLNLLKKLRQIIK